MAKLYKDISECGSGVEEFRHFDGDIEKDLLRTFPRVPQFAFSRDSDKLQGISQTLRTEMMKNNENIKIEN